VALSSFNPVLTQNADGTYHLQVGPFGWDLPQGSAVSLLKAEVKDLPFIIGQIAVQLDQSGFTLAGKTFAQVQAAVQATTVKM